VAQLVAHHTGSVGVRGSSPLGSTQGQTPRSRGINSDLGVLRLRHMIMARAQYVPNALRDVLALSCRLLVVWVAPGLIDQYVQGRCDCLISLPGGVLVDHRGPGA
jgi:hypothetical protein